MSAFVCLQAAVLSHPLVVLALAVISLLLYPWAKNRWEYRNVPGPINLPFIGNLPGITKYGLHEYMLRCRQRYGKTFKMYIGSQMMLVTADPAAARSLNYKMLNRNIAARQLNIDLDDKISQDGLVIARGDMWRTLRLAWQPAFQSGSLEGYCQLMDTSAKALADRLRKKGESGEVVEMWRELGKMTLHVVGSTAYGVDFHTLAEQDSASKEAAEGLKLIEACQTVFSASSLTKGSIYLLLNAMFPWPRLVSWCARNMPDRRLLELLQARRTIRAVSTNLIAGWRAAHPVTISADATTNKPASNGTAPAAAAAETGASGKETPLIETISATVATSDGAHGDAVPSQMARDQAGNAAIAAEMKKSAAAAGGGGVRRAAGMGVTPGSFMGLMLTARDKASGQHLTDNSVIAQANTFTLAGYETSANTLAFSVYNIARHPAVQERLLAEIDAYGRDRPVEYKDLGQFPYAEAIVREALRLYPPATMISREIKEGGYDLTPQVHVPVKGIVFSFLYGYQRDPEYWPAAEEFRPERWLPEGSHLAPTTPDAWTPFGTGPRMCIGWKFALQEIKIALVRLHQHQTYQLEPGQVPLALQQNITLSPRNGVKVRVIPRD